MKSHPKRKNIFFPRGFQLRYAFLVAGSLGVLLLFAGFHGFFIASSMLPTDVFQEYKPHLINSTLRLFVVGFLYITVVTLAATFLSHRTVGPTERLEKDINDIAKSKSQDPKLYVREGDELDGVVKAINNLIRSIKGRQRK